MLFQGKACAGAQTRQDDTHMSEPQTGAREAAPAMGGGPMRVCECLAEREKHGALS